MADLKNNKIDFLRILKTSKTAKSVSTEATTNPATKAMQDQFNMMQTLMIGVIIVLLITLATLVVGYFQFVANTYNDYKLTVHDYQDQRYIDLESKILRIEQSIQGSAAAGLTRF